jgi:AsmA protein
MKALKYALLGVGAIALVGLALAAYLIATFDPRDYEPQISAYVKEKTGRRLRIGGDFKLAFWPDVGVKLGSVSVSERDSDERFADAAEVRLTVKLKPLFSRVLVVEDLLVEAAHVRITRFADGRLNIDDLLSSEGPPPQFDIGRVRVLRSAVSYHDVATHARYELTAVELETGRLTTPIVTPVKLSLAAHDAAKTFAVTSKLEGRLGIDLAESRYALEQATLELTGDVPEVSRLAARLKGSFSARPKAREVQVTALGVAASGEIRGEQIEADVHILKLSARASSLAAQSVDGLLTVSSPAGSTRVTLAAPALVREGHSIVAEAATLELDAARGEHALRASLASRVDAQIDTGTVTLPKLDAKVTMRSAGLPVQGLSGTLTGQVRFESTTQTAETALSGTFAGSRVKAEIAAAGFATPVYRFTVDVDRIDLDRYATRAASRSSGGSDFDLSSVATLPASGTVHIGTLTTGGLKARNVKLAVKR